MITFLLAWAALCAAFCLGFFVAAVLAVASRPQ